MPDLDARALLVEALDFFNDHPCFSLRRNLLLLGEDDALLARLREAVFEHVQWLIPGGRSLTISADKNRLSLSLDQAA